MMRSTPAITRREIFPKNTQELLVSTEQQLIDGVSSVTTVSFDSTTYEMSLSFGSFRVRISSHTTKPKGSRLSVMDLTHKRRRKEITASFIPGCFMSSAFEWTLSTGFYSQMVLKCFNLRPGWSPIFRYSAEGDLYTVQTLIDGGSASIYDVDEVGWTPLHVCHLSITIATTNPFLPTVRCFISPGENVSHAHRYGCSNERRDHPPGDTTAAGHEETALDATVSRKLSEPQRRIQHRYDQSSRSTSEK